MAALDARPGIAGGGRGRAAAALAATVAGCAAGKPAAPPMPDASTNLARAAAPAQPSFDSEQLKDGESLKQFYASVEDHLTSNGRLRREAAPADAPYSDDDLVRDFVNIALKDEYTDLNGSFTHVERPALLRRWEKPVRVGVVSGASMSPEDAARDRANVAAFTRRLAHLTGRDVGMSQGGDVNFLVLFVDSAERPAVAEQVKAMYPGLAPSVIALLRDTPMDIFCATVAFLRSKGAIDLFDGDRADPRRASAADPALVRATRRWPRRWACRTTARWHGRRCSTTTSSSRC